MTSIDPQLYIHSIALSFNKVFINNLHSAHRLAEIYPAYRLLYYGDRGILLVNGNVINTVEPVIHQVYWILTGLVKMGILNGDIRLYHLTLHELELKYCFSYSQPFFCSPNGFSKVNNRWLSNDYCRIYRSNGELKGAQKSFICAELFHRENRANLIFNLSGRKRQYLSLQILGYTIPHLFIQLIPLLSCYLTQAANPDDFRIETEYLYYMRPEFRQIFENAGWFTEDRFVRKRFRKNSDGGFLWSK
ncbi:hypothetical protein AGMMS50212_10320 [Spirochaetia bacterium]|nr:hypothetical protein AGMMS50212_10320 [Spirochaetia bacterium]